MKREEIIKTWLEAGFSTIPDGVALQKLQRFVELVAAAEREVCANVCEEVIEFPAGHSGQWEGYGPVKTTRSGKECAAAIRARGKQ